jgi:hypothetical protein
MYEELNMSKLQFVNFYFTQWLFFRICRFEDHRGRQTHWGILFPVIPWSGWDGRKYIPKNYLRIKLIKTLNQLE